eukprot:m.438756 g.438756  ORF g.438756 m.438756 type:complete len:217 (-) comp18281_c0_seq1:144-794(-)
MSDAFHKSEFINRDWVPKVKIVIFDFDKTITNKHTGGSVLLPVHATDEFIEGNFADLEFLKFVVPFIRAQGVQVAIASFGEDDPESLLSGMALIRKYLDTAFGQKKSRDLFPDHAIALWHPERKNPPRDEKKVGKEEHIAEVVKNLSVKCKPSEIVLFDDDATNIKIAGKKGHRAIMCHAYSSKEQEKGKATGFNRDVWKDFVKSKGGSAGGCTIQ